VDKASTTYLSILCLDAGCPLVVDPNAYKELIRLMPHDSYVKVTSSALTGQNRFNFSRSVVRWR